MRSAKPFGAASLARAPTDAIALGRMLAPEASGDRFRVRLDRALADRRAYPAIDVAGSSTRHEDQLFDADTLAQVAVLRGFVADVAAERGVAAAHAELLEHLGTAKTNDQFLREVGKSASAS